MIRERFIPVAGYEDLYEISNHGRIKTLDRKCPGRIMKLEQDRSDYLVVRLVRFGVAKKFAIHRLVFIHFNGDLGNDEVVHHIDEDKHNNIASNLMKLTVAEHRALHNKGSVAPIRISISSL